MKITNERMAHMHGVAEWMYEHAARFGCENKDDMYILGLLHDIGYIYGKAGHELKGAELIGDSKYAHCVQYHGFTPYEYMDCHNCFASEIPKELILLWTADMIVDLTGKPVGFRARLKGIRERYGSDSRQYKVCKETMLWLEENNYYNVQ